MKEAPFLVQSRRIEARRGLAEATPRKRNWHKDKARLMGLKTNTIVEVQ